MKSHVLLTPITNIVSDRAINKKLISEHIYDTNIDSFVFEDINTGKRRRGNLMGVSLDDDVIIIADIKFKILKMLSK